MRVPRLFRPRLPGKGLHEWRLALHQVRKARLYRGEVVERVHALRAATQFPGTLRTGQKHQAQYGVLMTVEVVGLLQPVLVLGDPAVRGTDRPYERLSLQKLQRLANR